MNRKGLGNHASYLVFVCSLAVLFALDAAASDRYAILIGHDLGYPGEDPLRFAERDAERFRDVLVELGSFRKENTLLLQGPTIAESTAAVGRLRNKLQKEGVAAQAPLILLYFAGHGDKNNLHLARESFSRKSLESLLRDLPAGLKILVLDTCQTERVIRPLGVKSGPSFDIGVITSSMTKGLVILHSARTGEPAHESDTLGGAVFSHFLISALRGAGDVDQDGQVTLLEAYSFAYRQTVQHSARSSTTVQVPSFEMELAGSGELVLTRPRAASARIVLPAGEEARFLVFQNPSGSLVAEAISSPSHPVQLAVPHGRLVVHRRVMQRYQVAEIELPFGGLRKLTLGDFKDRPYEQLARRGGLFELYPNILGCGYLIRYERFPSNWMLRHGPRFFLEHSLGDWAIGLETGVTFSNDEQVAYRTDEIAIGTRGVIARRVGMGATTLGLGLGAGISVLIQNRSRSDSDRLNQGGIEIPPDISHTTIAPTAGIHVDWQVPLGHGFLGSVYIRTDFSFLRMADDNETSWRITPAIGTGIGLGTRF